MDVTCDNCTNSKIGDLLVWINNLWGFSCSLCVARYEEQEREKEIYRRKFVVRVR